MKVVALEAMLPLIEEAFSRGQTVTIPVTGTSMQPLLNPKDAVTLSKMDLSRIERGDIVLYRRENGQFVLHRVVQVHDDTVDFCGDNQVSIEYGVPKSRLLAQVVAYEQDGECTELDALRAEGCRRLQSRPVRAAATKYHKLRVAQERQQQKNNASRRYLYSYLKVHIPLIALMCVLSAVSAFSTLGMALASGRVIDKALGGDMHNFAQWFWILFALLVVVAMCSVLYSNIRVRAVGKMRNALRRDLFEELIRKHYTSLQRIHSGEILNRMTADVQIVVDNAITLIPQAISMVIKLLGGLSFMMFYEPLFTSVIVLGGAVLATLVQCFSRFYKAMHKQCQETEGRTRSYLQECIENIVVIKSFVNDEAVLEKLDAYQQDNLKKQVKRNAFANIGNTAIYAGFTFAYYAGLAWGVLRIAGVIGTMPMSVGIFATLLQIMEQIRTPFRSASGLVPQMYAMFASAERLYELSQLPDEPLDKRFDDTWTKRFSALVFDAVSFSYDDGKSILRNAAVSLKKGEFAVLAGASGVGKTTIIKLLLGLLEPQSGSLYMTDGQERVALCASTRAMFSYTPQGNMLLSGTLRDNITFGAGAVSQQELDRVLALACLQETVAVLPNGVDTVIGERGIGLSEGQLQRVAVARALLSEAPILLLDECTSALDEVNEQQLLRNLRSLKDRTILFISHRPAVLQAADTVWTINDGEISCKTTKIGEDGHEINTGLSEFE